MSLKNMNPINWNDFLPGKAIDEGLYRLFKERAEELTVKVLRAASPGSALDLMREEIKELKIRRAAASPLNLVDVERLEKHLAAGDIDFSTRLDRERIEQADLGISRFDLGIAETGSIVQDASGLPARLVSMLPPVHLAILPTLALVETFEEALEVVEKIYGETMPPFLSFITGPSKTADIERELTIGVHGPEKIVILCVDGPGT